MSSIVLDSDMGYHRRSSGTIIAKDDIFTIASLSGLTGWYKVGVKTYSCIGANFDATSSQSFSKADNASLSTGDITFSCGAWIWLDDYTHNRIIISKSDNKAIALSLEYCLWYDTVANKIKFSVSDGATITTVVADTFGGLSLAGTYFVSGGHNKDTNEIWVAVNNTVDAISYSGGVADTGFAFRIGFDGALIAADYMDGTIDEAFFCKSDIRSYLTTLYNSGNGYGYSNFPSGITNVKGYWSFGGDISSSATDLSGNSNDLTNNNTVTQLTNSFYRRTGGNNPAFPASPANANEYVTDLGDSSGQDNHLAVSGVASPVNNQSPILILNSINSQPVLRFNGTSNYLTLTAFRSMINFDAYSYSMVAKAIAINTDEATITDNDALIGDANENFGIYLKSGTPSASMLNADAIDWNTVEKTIAIGTAYLFNARLDSGNMKFSLNDGSEGTTASGDIDNPSNTLYVGSGNVAYCNCDIAELFIRNVAGNVGDRTNIKSYISSEYALW